ncbi:MAG: hypothetical protein ACTSRZ_09720 [Promethearchaeota archaeon]
MNWIEYKKKLEQKYNIELLDSDEEIYKKYKPKVGSAAVGIIFGTLIVLIAVTGILVGELSLDQYTLLPLFLGFCFLISGANNVTKIVEQQEKKFINEIRTMRVQQESQIHKPKQIPTPQGSTPQVPTPHVPTPHVPTPQPINNETPSSEIKKPVLATECPICHSLIAIGSNPCPICGTPLKWS